MTERVVAVLLRSPITERTDATASDWRKLSLAMIEDVVDLVAETPAVTPAVAVAPGARRLAEAVSWPEMPRVDLAEPITVATAVDAAQVLATEAVAVVVADVPDLPTLLLGKLFSALAGPPRCPIAVCPAAAGGLVAAALAVGMVPDWLARLEVGFDDPDALEQLQRAAPTGQLVVGPGWHRVRSPADAAMLDPGLEGWERTRALLG